MKPVVSIIIPVFNRAHCIEETLESVIDQRFKDWECLIIDDGSTDDSMHIIKQWSLKDQRFQLIQRPKSRKKGANACRNLGIENSKGRYLLFLDSDDKLSSSALENRVEVMQSHPELDAAVFGVSYFNPEGKEHIPQQKNFIASDKKDYLLAFLSYNLPWVITSPFWKRNCLETIEWDEDLQRLQDVDFHIRLLSEEGLKIRRFETIDHHIRAASETKVLDLDHVKPVLESYLLLLNKLLPQFNGNTHYYSALKQMILNFEWTYVIPSKKMFPELTKSIRKRVSHSRIFSPREKVIKNWEFYNRSKKAENKQGIATHTIRNSYKTIFKIS